MSTALKLMTVEEFLPWAEGKEGRWELYDGVPVMMSPERSLHAETKAETYVALREAIRLKAPPCRVLSGRDGSPDRCARDIRTRRINCLRPPSSRRRYRDPPIPSSWSKCCLPSTAAIDHGRKLSGYFSLPSVQHYLILDPDWRVAIHHKRGEWRRNRD